MPLVLLMEMPSGNPADQGAGKGNKSNDFHLWGRNSVKRGNEEAGAAYDPGVPGKR